MNSTCRDSGSIVVGWLTKLIVVLFLAGVVLFDFVSVGVARMTASDDANTAAQAAACDWWHEHNVQSAYAAAVAAIPSPAERVLTRGFQIESDGSVQLLLRRDVTTLVAYRISPLKKYTVATEQGKAVPCTV